MGGWKKNLKMKLEKELKIAKRISRESGNMLLQIRKEKMEIFFKKDKSIVTAADKTSSDFIYKELKANFPNYCIIDEERNEDFRGKSKFCWVVDPLDGTFDYVNGFENFGVMIGLMKNLKPVLGVVYKPVNNEMIYAVKGQHAFLEKGNEKKRINVSLSRKLNILVSKNRGNSELNTALSRLNPDSVVPMSSSFKISEVAKGNATHFICIPSTTMNLWDLCSQQVILEEAGGIMLDYNGNKINYAGDLVNRFGIIASNKNNIWRKLK